MDKVEAEQRVDSGEAEQKDDSVTAEAEQRVDGVGTEQRIDSAETEQRVDSVEDEQNVDHVGNVEMEETTSMTNDAENIVTRLSGLDKKMAELEKVEKDVKRAIQDNCVKSWKQRLKSCPFRVRQTSCICEFQGNNDTLGAEINQVDV